MCTLNSHAKTHAKKKLWLQENVQNVTTLIVPPKQDWEKNLQNIFSVVLLTQ